MGIQTNKISKLSNRRAMFESPNTKTKPKKTKPIPITNKPKKKWTVKGIDDKSTTAKKVVHVTNSAHQSTRVEDAEPSISMSHKDRMKMYEKDIADTAEKEKQRMLKHK